MWWMWMCILLRWRNDVNRRGFYFLTFWGLAMDKDSLIQRAKAQMDLIPSTELPDILFQKDEELMAGEFTGERLWDQRPDTYQAIVSLLAEKKGVIWIGRVLKVSPNTVRAVQLREGISIDIEKERLANVAHQGAALAFEAVVENLSDATIRRKTSVKDLALTGAVLVDKGQLLRGEATSRLELHEVRTPDHDDFNAYVAGLKSAGTGSAVGTDGQKGAVLEVGAVGEMAKADSESDGKKENNQ